LTSTQQKNYYTLIVTLAAGINSALIGFHVYHLTNGQLQYLDTSVSEILAIIGICLSHRKKLADSIKGLFKRSSSVTIKK